MATTPRRASDAGMDGLIVSNRGGRQADGSVSVLEALITVMRRQVRQPGGPEC